MCAVAGGLGADALGVPAGPLLGAIAAVGLLTFLAPGFVEIPRLARGGGRILAGAAAGSLISLPVLIMVRDELALIIAANAVVICLSLAAAWVLSRATVLDMRSSVIATAPGGLTEMTSLAHEMKTQVEVVIAVHMVRKTFVLIAAIGLATWSSR